MVLEALKHVRVCCGLKPCLSWGWIGISMYQICESVDWWDVFDGRHQRYIRSMAAWLAFPIPKSHVLLLFCSYICSFFMSALSSFRSFPWLPVLQSLPDVPIVIPFLFFHPSLRAKLKKKKNPKKKRKSKLLAGLVCLLTVTPIACLLFGLHGSSWGMTCTDWVRIWLWVGCSRLALRMWVTQESEKVSLASLAARGICAMWWAQVDTLELHLQLDLH